MANKAALEKSGVYYPNEIYDFPIKARYRYAHRDSRGLKTLTDSHIQDIWRVARTKNCSTVILMNENPFGIKGEEEDVSHLDSVCTQFLKHGEIKIVMYVRGMYEWLWSMYTQDRKVQGDFSSFPERVQKHGAPSFRLSQVRSIMESPWSQYTSLYNYNKHKSAIVSHMLAVTTGLDSAQFEVPTKQINPSPTLSQMNILQALQGTRLKAGPIGRRWHLFQKMNSTNPGKAFKWYDPETAKIIYEKFKSEIEYINLCLKEGDALSTTPYQPPGFTTEWDTSLIDPLDMEILLNVIKDGGVHEGTQLVAPWMS